MSEYRRFISYIYAYRKGRKETNCGYVKVEIRNGVCRLRLHLQNAVKSGSVLQVYGFVRGQDKILGVLLGNVGCKNNMCDFQASSPAAAIADTAYSIDDMRGIWLKGEEEENYITVWDDEPVLVEQFRVIDEEETVDREEEEQITGTEDAVIESEDTVIETEETGEIAPDDELVETQELGTEQEQQTGNLWARWDNFLNHYPRIQPFTDAEITQCICIAPKDLSFLQREEWQYSRNTFVRQAYTRYHHLMLGCHISGRFVLAVPGTSDAQEKHMARMHGFPYYKEALSRQPVYSEVRAAGQEDTTELTGYWYHFLNESYPQ